MKMLRLLLLLVGAASAVCAQSKAPTVTLTPGAPTQTISLGESVTYTSEATDADKTMEAHHLDWRDPEGRWKWQGTSEGLNFSEVEEKWFGASGSSSRTITVTPKRAGVYLIKFSALDGGAWTESPIVELTVKDKPAPWTVSMVPEGPHTVAVNQPITFLSVAASEAADITGHNFDWADTSGRWVWDNGADVQALALDTQREITFSPTNRHSRSLTVTPRKPGTYKIRFALQREGKWMPGKETTLVVTGAKK